MHVMRIFWGRYSLWFYSGSLSCFSFFHRIILPFSVLSWASSFFFAALFFIGLHDYTQKQRAVRANYPLMGRMRYILESIRPELRRIFGKQTQKKFPIHVISVQWSISAASKLQQHGQWALCLMYMQKIITG